MCAYDHVLSYPFVLQRIFAQSDIDYFSKVCVALLSLNVYIYLFWQVVLEQLNRPEERRCPIARASNEVVELLCEHWSIFAPGCESTAL